MRLLRDEAQLRYSFGKLGKEGWEALANGKPSDVDPQVIQRAWRAYTAGYRQPEQLHPAALAELAADLRAGSLPRWALRQYGPDEIQQINDAMRR